jgi:hypothetical protein
MVGVYYVRTLLGLLLITLASICSVMPPHALAQNGGVQIQPAIIEPTGALLPGSTHTYEIRVENLNSGPETYYLSVRDISDVGEGGVPVFLEPGDESGYELSRWITLSQSQITVEPGAEVVVPFSITIPSDASPGGHFGSVMITSEAPEIRESGAAVGFQVANIISLRIAGDIVEQAAIRQFSTDQFLYGNKNVTFSVNIENTGNVLVRPIGPLIVRNMFGQEVASLTMNESLAGVFPGRVRDDIRVVWSEDGSGFGRYEAVVSMIYGEVNGKQTTSSTVSFWILPMSIIGPALGILVALLLVVFITVRLYIRRTLAHAMPIRGRQMVRRRQGGTNVWLLMTVILLAVTALFMLVLLALFA